MSQDVSFNLVDEPWIRIRDEGGEVREVSLAEIFEQAPHIVCLANDLPTQDFAILRVLLAILQRAISPTLDEDDDPAEVWGRLWNAPELPLDAIRDYLIEWRYRFDLFDEERPFMQVAGLYWRNESGTKTNAPNVSRLIADVPSREKRRLFAQRAGSGIDKLTFAEAARWLIHLQAFDVGSPGAPVAGEADENVKKGKVYPGGMSWAGRLGCLYLEGKSLKDTMILNFVPTQSRGDYQLYPEDDLPSWEVEPLSVLDGHAETLPKGRADLFAWQSRWVRLIPNGQYVIDAVVSAGKKLGGGNRYLYQFEPMSAWRSAADGSGEKSQEIRLMQHPENTALWRGLSSVFGGYDDRKRYCYPPEVISWAERMSGRDVGRILQSDSVVCMHATGLRYTTDSSNSSYTNLFDDKIELSAFLLSPEGEGLVSLAKACASSTTEAINALGDFAANLCRASGGSGDDEIKGAKNASKAQAFFEVDQPFRLWLASLNENSDAEEERAHWRRTACSILKAAAANLLQGLSADAIVGSPAREGKGKGWMTASKAEAIFKAALKKALPLEEDVEQKEKEVR